MKKQPLKYRYNVLGAAIFSFLCVRNYAQMGFRSLGLDKNFSLWLVACMVSLFLSCLVPIIIIEKMCNFHPFLFKKVKPGVSFALISYSMLFITGFSVINQMIFNLLQRAGVVFPAEKLLPIEGPLNFVLYFIFIAILPAFCEETFMRGYVLNMFSDYGKGFAIILTAAFFTLMHTNVQSFLPVFVAGLLLGCISAQTGSIWVCIGLHFVNNAYSFIMMYFTQTIGGVSTLAFASFTNMLILCCGLGARYYLHKNGIYLSRLLGDTGKQKGKRAVLFKSPLALIAIFSCLAVIGEQIYMLFSK